MTTTELEKEVVEHIDELIRLAGLDRSESATEEFILLLDPAIEKAKKEMARSYHQGLCFDCRWSLVEAITKSNIKRRVQ